jgi:nascent polypeptide-associated complex subunit beta
MNVQPIQAIEEVNMFKEDGNVIHFAAPKGEYLNSDVPLPCPPPSPKGEN